jgi:hypothetical protein
MSDKIRCIGGSKDGEYLEYPRYGGFLHVPIFKDFKACADYYDTSTVTAPAIQTDIYRIEQLHGKDRTFKLLVHSSLTIDEALDRLINLF